MGNHRGYPKSAFIRSCLNHGEPNPNPKSPYPDSFCGKPFIAKEVKKGANDDDEDKCVYHSGFFRIKNKKSGEGMWSCCQAEEREGAGCSEDKHKFAEWPDEEAKKYFFDKPLKNPADNWKSPQIRTDYELWGRYSGYFRKPVPYEAKNPGRPPALTADEEKKLAIKDKICLNWACSKLYKHVHNHKRACKCHPGKWDFGYSGQNVSAAMGGIDPDE